ncbi:hypothetical protein [Amazonocrinis nigriterrae]|nr:hypothetical protein [Amazonocrinis nigriterrae]
MKLSNSAIRTRRAKSTGRSPEMINFGWERSLLTCAFDLQVNL